MEKWLTVKEYAKKENISLAAVSMRMKRGSIPADRIRRNDGNRILIKIEEYNK